VVTLAFILGEFCGNALVNAPSTLLPHAGEGSFMFTLAFIPVLWIRIRIRNNPNVLAGSESESEQKVRIRIRIRIRIQTLL
jgi:hypothetical protein